MLLNVHLETGKKNIQSNSSFIQHRQSQSINKVKEQPIKPIVFINSLREPTNNLSTNTNNNTYYKATVTENNTFYKGTETKESIKEFSTKPSKLAPINYGQRRTKSNWGEEIREQIPELLKQIRRKIK